MIVKRKKLNFWERLYLPAIIGGFKVTLRHFFERKVTLQYPEEKWTVPEGYRGIQETVVGPGRYYVNTLAISPIVIPTTNQTVEWTSGEVVNTFNPFEVISKDGFTMQLEVRVVFRVKPEDALPHYEHREAQGIKTVVMYE